jgi:plasmid stabilization system protein ParE
MTPRASADLEDIFLYIEKESPQNAAAVAARLISAVDSLEILPHRNVIYTGKHSLSEPVRRMPVPPFIVYYRVDDAALTVDVVTIRHGMRREPPRIG